MTLRGRGAGCVVRKYDSVLLAWFILAAAALFSFSKKNPFHGRETTTIMNATSKELPFSIDKNVHMFLSDNIPIFCMWKSFQASLNSLFRTR